MALDYVVDLPCRPKQTLGTGKILELLILRGAAMFTLDDNQHNVGRPWRRLTFSNVVTRPTGAVKVKSSVTKALKQAAQLDAFVDDCLACPANNDGHSGFGCYGRVNYPLDLATEEMLLSMLPDDLTAAGAGTEFKAGWDYFGWDGSQAAEVRAASRTFFESPVAPVRQWPTGEILTGDQVFEMLFIGQGFEWSLAKLLAISFRLIILDEEAGPLLDLAIPESEQASQVIAYLNSISFAALNELPVLLDG
ncbi:hypothetical protein ACFWPK_10680 [Nocardia sp. NPDC058519]|uniref:hypothetical protein n=1 Tax=Nocardia sp. NPDC058519 TaxID=3346535 RepID=UPI003648B59C